MCSRPSSAPRAQLRKSRATRAQSRQNPGPRRARAGGSLSHPSPKLPLCDYLFLRGGHTQGPSTPPKRQRLGRQEHRGLAHCSLELGGSCCPNPFSWRLCSAGAQPAARRPSTAAGWSGRGQKEEPCVRCWITEAQPRSPTLCRRGGWERHCRGRGIAGVEALQW